MENKMKRTAIILVALMFVSFLFTSCQKAKEPEGKKKVQAQKEELKPQPSETKSESKQEAKSQPEQQSPQPATAPKEIPQTASAPERETQFKEPVLLWEREFDPPLIDISDQNSAGEYIAIQGGGKEGRPTKILFLNSKGQTVRDIPLVKKEKRRITPEQVWLTYYGEQWRDEKFKKGFVEGIEIETEVYKAFISGNGEYYGIVTWDTKFIEPEYQSPWYEFAYYDKTGKLLWKHVSDVNYGFSTAHISYDGSRIILIDEAQLDYFGQKWYLYDEKGKMLKAEDHLLRALGNQKEWDREKGEWIDIVRFSIDAKYIGVLSERVADKTIVKLLDTNGNLLWTKEFEKDFFFISTRGGISNNGHLFLEGRDNLYSLDKKGNILWRRPFIKSRFCGNVSLSTNGKYVYISEDEDFFIYDNSKGNEILKVNVNALLKLGESYQGWVGCGDFSPSGEYLLFPYAYILKKYAKRQQEKEEMFKARKGLFFTREEKKVLYSIALFNLKENSILWEKKNFAEPIVKSIITRFDKRSRMIKSLGDNYKKVAFFDWERKR